MARKLNTKFIIGVAAAGALGVVGLTFGPTIMRPSVAKLTAEGEKAFQAGDYEGASVYLGKAVNRDQTNMPLSMKLIDALDYTVKGDLDKLRNLRQMQAHILANDPRSIPALRRVLDYQVSDVRDNPSDSSAVRSLTGTASRLLELQPDDLDAQKALIIAVLEPYSRNLEVSADAIDAQRTAAKALAEKHPTDPEVVDLAVRFALATAQHDAQQGDDQDIAVQIAAAKKLVDDVVAKSPQDGALWMARFNVYRALLGTPALTAAQTADYNKQAGTSLENADKFADPKKPDSFMAIRSFALKVKEQMNLKDAEAGYRKLIEEMPNDRQPRMMLANFLDRQPARREEAIAVLEKPWKPTSPLHALESRRQAVNELIERVRLCTIKLGALDAVTDAADRAKRLKDVEKSFSDLQSNADVMAIMKPAMLRIQGGIAMEHGNILEAINTFDSALKLLSADSPYSLEQDTRNDVLLQYAQAELRLGQTGRARPLLSDLVQPKPGNPRPDNLMARAMLADLLITERNYQDAAQQVNILLKVLPGNPQIERMNVRLLALRSDALKDHYKDMPETTRDQQLTKLTAANTLGDTGELTRIAHLMLQTDPADVDAVNLLAQVLTRTDHRDEAVAIVNTALQKAPDNDRLKAMKTALEATTPESQQAAIKEQIDKIADPFEKLLAQSDFARNNGKTDEAIDDLKKAAALKAADPRPPEALFRLYLAQKQWDNAQATVEILTKLNADQASGEIRRVQLAAAKALAEPVAAKREAAFNDALNLAAALSQKYTEIANATLLYAQMLQQSGKLSDAADQYTVVLDKSPTNLDGLVGSSQCLLSLSRVTEARSRLDQAQRVAPDDGRVRQLELTYQLQFGDPLKAVDMLQTAVNQNPKNPLAWGQLGTALDQLSRVKTAAHDDTAAKQFAQRASDLYEKAIAQFPDDLRFPVALADARRRMGDSAGAEKIFAGLLTNDKYKDNAEVNELVADQYARSGKPDEAERILHSLINRVKPAPLTSVLKLSLLYAQMQRLPDALATLDLRPDSGEAQRQRIQLLVSANNLDQARLAVDAALAKFPSADTFLLAAYMEIRGGHFDKADGFLNRVFQERPNDPAALFYRAQVKLSRTPADVDGARADLQQARDLAPDNVDARVALADVLMRKQDQTAAISELQAAWKTNSTSKAILLKLADAYANDRPPQWSNLERVLNEAKQSPQLAADPDVLLTEASMWIGRQSLTKAVDAGRAALAISPTNADLQQRYFDVLLRARDFRDLISESDVVLQQDRGAWWLYRLRGQAYRRQDMSTEAAREFDSAFNLVAAANNERGIGLVARTIADELGSKAAIAKIEPLAAKSPAARLLLASFYSADQNLPALHEQLEALMADRSKLRDDQLRQALQMLGNYYLASATPDPKKARETFEELLKQTPNDILVLNNLASVLIQPGSGGTPAEALKYSQRAYDLANTYGRSEMTLYVMDTHGWILVQNNRLDEGLDLLRQAAQTAQFPDVHLHLAEAELKSGNVDGAEDDLSHAKRILDRLDHNKQPVDPALRPKLEQLTAQISTIRSAKTTAG